jgi:hypothetical protein
VTEEGRLGASDHVIIQMNIVIRNSRQPESQGLPDWHRVDWDGMRRDFERDRWPARLRGMSAEQAWTALKEQVHELVNKHVPERRRRNHNRQNREILRTIRKKKRLWRRAREGQGVAEYKEVEKKLRNMIRNAKRSFEKKIVKGTGSEQSNKRKFPSLTSSARLRAGLGSGHLRTAQDELCRTVGRWPIFSTNFSAASFRTRARLRCRSRIAGTSCPGSK